MKSDLKHSALLFSLSTLLILLPLNTVLVQLLVVKLGLPVWLSLWKELLAGIVMLICGWEMVQRAKCKVQSEEGKHPVSFAATPQEGNLNSATIDEKLRHPGLEPGSKSAKLKPYFPLILVSLMTLVGVLNSIGKVDLSYVIYGFRFELYWVWFWVILAVWGKGEVQSAKFKVQREEVKHPVSFAATPQEGNLNSMTIDEKLYHAQLVSGSKVALLIGFLLSSFFSLITIIFGPQNVFSWFGYGQTASQAGSELLFTQPVGHLIDAGGWNNSFRLSGSFSSPNHYAVYLILLLPLFLFKVFYEQSGKHPVRFASTPQEGNFLHYALSSKWFWVGCLILDLVFLGLTFARFSYLVLFVIFGVLLVVKIYNAKLESTQKEIVLGGVGLDLPRKRYVRAVIYNPKNQNLLFSYFGNIAGENKLGLIGGSLDGAEDEVEALKREIIEETGYIDFKIISKLGGPILSPKDPEFDTQDIIKENNAYLVILNSEKRIDRNFTDNEIKNGLSLKWIEIDKIKDEVKFDGFYSQYNFFLERGVSRVQSSKFKVQSWYKNLVLGLIFAIPLLISVVVLNLPVNVLQSYFPSWLAKPSSTEWHQQHTAAAWRALTLQTHPEVLNQTKLDDSDILRLSNLNQQSNQLAPITYRLLTGYGMGTTDPASKYLPTETNPIAKLGFGLDDELYFPRVIDRPLALTPENWFLGLWVKGGIFYMLLFMAILSYFMRDIRLLFSSSLIALQEPQNMLRLLVSLSIFGLTTGAFLLDIFDSQSLALLIGPIYLGYIQQTLYYDR